MRTRDSEPAPHAFLVGEVFLSKDFLEEAFLSLDEA
jgi:hypothetical protein